MSIRLRYPEGKAKAVTLSYDDGVMQDKRFVEILNKYGLKCTFNVNSGLMRNDCIWSTRGVDVVRMTPEQCIETFKGHEVAVHTYTHAALDTLKKSEIIEEISKDRINLEKIIGGLVRGMAYPYGTYNDGVLDCLESCGIAYSRTVNSTGKFDLPNNWLTLNPTCHHNDTELDKLMQKFVELEVDNLMQPQMFYLWGHSYEFDVDNNWKVIEVFAKNISGKADIWYATNIEIYEYIEAYNQLKFSYNHDYVENPTIYDVWLSYNDEIIVVKAGTKQLLKH